MKTIPKIQKGIKRRQHEIEPYLDYEQIFGESKEFGFAIIRVLGDEMNVSKIMELGPIINKLDTKEMNVEGFLDFML